MPKDTFPAADPGLPISRHQLERMIASAIDYLDLLDPDPDLEDTQDAEGDDAEREPSLASVGDLNQERWAAGSVSGEDFELDDSDLEDNGDLEPSLGSGYGEPDLELDNSDCEPSLGSLDRHDNQDRWAGFTSGFDDGTDRELDRSDNESSLGAPVGNGNQTHWAQGIDAEHNGDEDDENGDERDGCNNGGNGPSEDDPIFPRNRLEMLHVEAAETYRVAARLADHVQRLQDAERLGMLS